MQSISLVVCPWCGRPPMQTVNTGEAFNTHVCYADCGNVYWSLRICPRCQHPEQTIFLKKPNFSELIMCRNCKSNMYYFRCPQKSCEVLFYKDYESYLIGFPVECTNCHFKYRTLACTCGNEIRLHIDTIITEGISKFICPTCRKDVIYTICSKCFKTEYHMETLEIGDNIRCTNCKTRRVFVPCPYCRRSTKGLKFNFRELNQCNYCQRSFEYTKCPSGCGTNFNEHSLQHPQRVCKCCEQSYFIINCDKCSTSLYLDGIDEHMVRKEKCPEKSCGADLQFYLCSTCNMFNPNGDKCLKITCPLPKGTISYSNPIQQTAIVPNNSNYNEKQCKLCMQNDSEIMNETCRHMMMCSPCYQTYRRTQNSLNQLSEIPCPVCKIFGRYHKFLEPIYQ